jgi:hypothetical protein
VRVFEGRAYKRTLAEANDHGTSALDTPSPRSPVDPDTSRPRGPNDTVVRSRTTKPVQIGTTRIADSYETRLARCVSSYAHIVDVFPIKARRTQVPFYP